MSSALKTEIIVVSSVFLVALVGSVVLVGVCMFINAEGPMDKYMDGSFVFHVFLFDCLFDHLII